jgi:hypothetical protein
MAEEVAKIVSTPPLHRWADLYNDSMRVTTETIAAAVAPTIVAAALVILNLTSPAITIKGDLPDGITRSDITAISDAVVAAGGTARPITIDFTGSGLASDQVGESNGSTISVRRISGDAGKALLIHEIAHSYDDQNGHTQAWGDMYLAAARKIIPDYLPHVVAQIVHHYGLAS